MSVVLPPYFVAEPTTRRLTAVRGRSPVVALDEFSVDDAAPLDATEAWVPGPRSWTVVGSDQSFSGGKLVMPANASSRSFIDTAALARQAGLALVFLGWQQTAAPSANGWSLGFRNTGSPSLTHHQGWYGNNANIFTNVNGQTGRALGAALSNSSDYDFAVVLRSTGCYLLYRLSSASAWSLLYVDDVNTDASLYADINYTNCALQLEAVRILQGWHLPRAAYSASGAIGVVTSGSGDSVGKLRCVGTGTQSLIFRRQDPDNYWYVERAATTIRLFEVVAGTPTQRATGTITAATGDRIQYQAIGNTIRIFHTTSAGVTVAPSAYASASNFATATGIAVLDEANYTELEVITVAQGGIV